MLDKTAAIYIRVSSKDQSHASQLPDLQRWSDGHDGEVKWYKDTFTGRTMNRPEMEKLLTELRAGKLDRIVVWRLDRLGRTTKGLCDLFDELRERRVDLVPFDFIEWAGGTRKLSMRLYESSLSKRIYADAERISWRDLIRCQLDQFGTESQAQPVEDTKQKELEAFRQSMEMFPASVADQQEFFTKVTGRSRASFYRLKKRLGQN